MSAVTEKLIENTEVFNSTYRKRAEDAVCYNPLCVCLSFLWTRQRLCNHRYLNFFAIICFRISELASFTILSSTTVEERETSTYAIKPVYYLYRYLRNKSV